MNYRRFILLTSTHLACIAVGFAAGVYTLPILIAPDSPSKAEIASAASRAIYSGEFRRNLKDSDALHWGAGKVSVSADVISFHGKLAPGPDYKLYLSPVFVETEADFKRLKANMARVGDIKTFDNFVVSVPAGIDTSKYSAVIIWCERFSQFITAASYK